MGILVMKKYICLALLAFVAILSSVMAVGTGSAGSVSTTPSNNANEAYGATVYTYESTNSYGVVTHTGVAG